MVKKAILLFAAAACFTGEVVKAQQARCFTDEMHERAKAANPAAVAAAEAQLKAQIDALMGRMDLPKLKVTAGETFADTATLMVPIVFHIVHNYNTQEYITDNLIYNELEEINKLYRGIVPDVSTFNVIPTYRGNIPGTSIKYVANTNIQFYLARKDPFGNPTTGITRKRDFSTTSGGNHAKFDLWPPQNYLNIWIVNAFDANHTGAAAFALKPAGASALPWYDGPITAMGQPFNFDNTIAHEIGHFLDLDHPWGGTNAPEVACGDDGVDDTPPTDGHAPGLGCNPVHLYDWKCVLTAAFIGKPAINNTNKVADNQTGQGIMFRNLEKVQIDSVKIYPAVSGAPFTIVLKHKNASGQYVTIATHNGITTTNTGAQNVNLLRFVAPIDTNVNAYSLEFSVNPSMYRDSTSAVAVPAAPTPLGNQGTIGNVMYFTDDTAQGRYNYFYNLGIRYGDYFVQYPPATAKDLFNITATGPVIIDYPDTVNSQNVMDYTYCSKMFTYLQGVRMRATLRSPIAGRSNLITPTNLMLTGVTDANGNLMPRADLPPVADFSVGVGAEQNAGFTCRGVGADAQNVRFANRAWGDTVSAIYWSFSNGASNANPVNANPNYNTSVTTKFNDTGWATIQMIAESNAGRDTLVVTDRVYVADENAIPAAGYFQEFTGNDVSMFPTFNHFNNFTKWEVVNNAGFYDNTSIRYKQYDNRLSAPAVLTGTPRGDYDDLFTRAFDLRGMGNTIYLSFFTAGAFRTNNPTYMNDELEISYTTNCGLNWQTLKTLKKSDISNNGTILTDWTPGGMWDWKGQNVAITTTNIAESLRGRVYFRFRYKPGVEPSSLVGTGNNFYLDRIYVSQWTTDVSDIANKQAGFTLAPNPTSGSTTVIVKDANSNDAHISVTDVTGKLVYSTQVNLSSGINRIEIPASYIAVKGMYLVSVTTGTHKQTEKLVVY
ncbi:MAG TPA: zinc-dependent metalloprotease [Flavipsychrobacter sp.]|nr:zinc-dependent metalloprotease [Flavipsychrobacter sp.]